MDEMTPMTQAQFPDLKDAGVLVTGGGSGIGASLVEAFAMQGAKVSFIDIAEEPSLALVKRLAPTAPHPVHFFKTDLRDIAAIGKTVEAAASATGGIKVLVNNAAWDDRHDIDTVTEAYWDDRLAVNLRPMMFVAQALAPDMRGLGGGALVNLSSTSWMKGSPQMIAYTTAKSAVIGFTRSLARALGPDGIRVNCVTPGWVMTGRQRTQWWTPEKGAANQAAQALKGAILPEDIAQMVLFLCSDVSRMCAGQNFIVDAGTV